MAEHESRQSEQERLRQQEREHQQLEQEHQHEASTASGAKKPDENLSPGSGETLVDPRPTAPPIKQGNTEYTFPPAAASPKEVLALEPNLYVDATDGPDPQIDPNRYVTWTNPNGGGEFIAPIANDETYERKGFTRGAEQDIPDLVAYQRERGMTDKQRETDKRKQDALEQRDRERRELIEQQTKTRQDKVSAGR